MKIKKINDDEMNEKLYIHQFKNST